MPRPMSVPERQAFLSDVHVGIVSVNDDDGRAPLSRPIWYRYEPGGLVTILTGRRSRKAALIRRLGRFSLTVQKETSPYGYVSVEGPVVAFEDRVDPSERRTVHEHYLGLELAEEVLAATEQFVDSQVTIRMRPDRWSTADYSSDFE
jgi:nitroimidazol reductase NimA-like FMN-containing flavoprotein (pyridoxamine 5'-phosphate oxidase superfamily)